MNPDQSPSKTIDDFIAQFPDDIQALLTQVRLTIKAAAPDAEEKISYQMPTFFLHGNLVHFAAWRNHIGFYPGASGIAVFQPELAKYKYAKGSVQFPFDQPIPHDLISKIVKFRVAENLKKAKQALNKKGRINRPFLLLRKLRLSPSTGSVPTGHEDERQIVDSVRSVP